ncbi:MAG: hypothetical protein JNM33_02190 [Rubrivivax sp.]|nr:hypothetical protein [Rubrivivax sp.]
MGETAPPVIDSRAAFRAALLWGFGSAFDEGARRIVCADAHFAEWPLEDAGLLAGLTAWMKRPQRRLVLLGAGFDVVQGRCPRFSAWRADWAHAVEAWQASQDMAADLPTVLTCDRGASVHLIDALHWRGSARQDERAARQWCETLDVVLQRSERAWAVRTLGL